MVSYGNVCSVQSPASQKENVGCSGLNSNAYPVKHTICPNRATYSPCGLQLLNGSSLIYQTRDQENQVSPYTSLRSTNHVQQYLIANQKHDRDRFTQT